MIENLKKLQELKKCYDNHKDKVPIPDIALEHMKYIIEQCHIHNLPQPEIFPYIGGGGLQAEWEYDWYIEIDSNKNGISMLCVKGKDYKNSIECDFSNIKCAFLLLREFLKHIVRMNEKE